MQNQMPKPRPIKKFRAGAISANIWRNFAKKGNQNLEFNSVTIERRYADKQGEWKSTNSYRPMDLPKVQLVLQKAYEFLMLNAEESPAEVENVEQN